jgi:hypothetical protein
VTESEVTPPSPPPQLPGDEPSFFDRRGVKATSFIVGIVGVAFGVWSHFASIKEPAITYTVNPIRTTLAQAGDTTGLSVQFNGERLTRAVTSVTIGIWNGGRAPVKASNVLEALDLKLPTNNRILSAKVLKQSRAIIQFQLGTGAPNALESRPQSSAHMSFNVMEHNDSAIVQIIYEGAPDADVIVSGIFDGQPAVLRLKEQRLEKQSTKAINPYIALVVALLAAGVGAFFSRGLKLFLNLFIKHPWKIVVAQISIGTWLAGMALMFITLSSFGFSAYIFYIDVIQPPPFSFSD